jgi:deoxyribodipyrimidine photo-lyase
MKTAIVWFKTDLRLDDNDLLKQLHRATSATCLLFWWFRVHNSYGYPKTGSFRAQFLLESLTDLDKNFTKVGFRLLIKGKQKWNS